MNNTMKPRILVAFAAVALMSCSSSYESPDAAPAAQDTGPDPTVVDADHYVTEFENDRVRVVRITYGPGEESVMHYHPDNVGVFLTDTSVSMKLPDGASAEMHRNAGQQTYAPAGQHAPKNIGDSPIELLLIELK